MTEGERADKLIVRADSSGNILSIIRSRPHTEGAPSRVGFVLAAGEVQREVDLPKELHGGGDLEPLFINYYLHVEGPDRAVLQTRDTRPAKS